MIANADRTGIIIMLSAIALAIALVVGGLVQDHYADDRPDACTCECP